MAYIRFQTILQLIFTRLFVVVGNPHRYAETVIELDCGGTVFSSKGRIVLHGSWKLPVQMKCPQ
ncbi:MAG: hypothetical protein ACI4D7_02275 [Lachnospiraceae bacterium]